MNDELAERVRSLEAERLRPVPPPPSRPVRRLTPGEMDELCEAVCPPDDPHPELQSDAAARLEDYAWLRGQGEPIEEAARRVGVQAKTARQKYEPQLKKENA
ncbi:hypothetical protein [Spirillospora sp. NBC_01491]|uniref:hypothetical protein n=1 Tax=Spirillospora sp. NBC_01491 TaxID=2976007 RepID=UPI002E35CF63|nr:hypothetical protein [Spirillospora sp. NBC_01491]